MKTQKCRHCKKQKPLNDFSIKKGEPTTLCLNCKREYQKKWYENNKEKTIKRLKRNEKRIKDWYRDYKESLSCEICGESESCCLQFHHKNGLEKENNIGHMVHRCNSIDKIKKEMAKCQVVCANCHFKIHAGVV